MLHKIGVAIKHMGICTQQKKAFITEAIFVDKAFKVHPFRDPVRLTIDSLLDITIMLAPQSLGIDMYWKIVD